MGEKKGQTVLLAVIGIATLLVTLVGATFAYFSAQFTDENPGTNNVTITSAELGTITFAHTNEIALNNVYPGAKDVVDFSVSSPSNATADVDYGVYLVVTENTFTTNNLIASFTAKPANALTTDAWKNGILSNTNFAKVTGEQNVATDNSSETVEYDYEGVLIATGKVTAKGTDNWSLQVELDETGELQTDDEGKTFTARIVVRPTTTYTQQSVYPAIQAD